MEHANLVEYLGIKHIGKLHYNLSVPELIEHAIRRNEGTLADSGGLCIRTGEFTGRSPKDKFVVEDDNTRDTVWWGTVNNRFSETQFDQLYRRMIAYLQGKELFVRDSFAGADPAHRISVRVFNENPYQNIFVHHLFIRPTEDELTQFSPDFTILAIPSFKADPAIDGTRQHNFTTINFTRRIILIGGSGYTGEIKKGIFTVMNYLLPLKGVLSMHCSANIGKDNDVALFYGLSGTGKTTLSADPNRALIGDDEHGWTDTGVFNIEGGCYAKCIDLSPEKEPEIWKAIRYGTLIENTSYVPNTRTVNYLDKSITENTRAAYPINYVDNAVHPSIGGLPKNIFFLTADAFGVLPPISKLTPGQAMYLFLSGFTAIVAGTEAGVKEPQPTFSPCFGQAFLPLHPTTYAKLLGEKMKKFNVNVWLVNTGWTGGPYGVGSRMKLPYTRAMIGAALSGQLDQVAFEADPVFGLQIPATVPNVPTELLIPRNTWAKSEDYDAQAQKLAGMFNQNFEKYSDFADDETKAAAPKVFTKA
jgi:phosphoenolpyruvate carboxykinase (ATP)